MKLKKLTVLGLGVFLALSLVGCDSNIGSTSTSDNTITSDTTDIYYTVVFKNEDGTNLSSLQVKENDMITFSGTNPTKEGYSFVGWDKNNDGEVDDFTPAIEDSVWKPIFEKNIIKHNLIIELGDKTVEKEYEEGATIDWDDLSTPTKEGYRFTGWKLKDSTEALPTVMGTDDLHIEPVFVIIEMISIRYYTNNAVSYYVDKNETSVINIEELYKGETPEKRGTYNTDYVFIGWTTTYKGNEALDLTAYDISNESEVSIYPVFEAKEKEFTLTLNDGDTSKDYKFKYSQEFDLTNISLEKDGYWIKGFYTDEACTILYNQDEYLRSDLTLYVVYEEILTKEEVLNEIDNFIVLNKNVNFSIPEVFDFDSTNQIASGDVLTYISSSLHESVISAYWRDGYLWTCSELDGITTYFVDEMSFEELNNNVKPYLNEFAGSSGFSSGIKSMNYIDGYYVILFEMNIDDEIISGSIRLNSNNYIVDAGNEMVITRGSKVSTNMPTEFKGNDGVSTVELTYQDGTVENIYALKELSINKNNITIPEGYEFLGFTGRSDYTNYSNSAVVRSKNDSFYVALKLDVTKYVEEILSIYNDLIPNKSFTFISKNGTYKYDATLNEASITMDTEKLIWAYIDYNTNIAKQLYGKNDLKYYSEGSASNSIFSIDSINGAVNFDGLSFTAKEDTPEGFILFSTTHSNRKNKLVYTQTELAMYSLDGDDEVLTYKFIIGDVNIEKPDDFDGESNVNREDDYVNFSDIHPEDGEKFIIAVWTTLSGYLDLKSLEKSGYTVYFLSPSTNDYEVQSVLGNGFVRTDSKAFCKVIDGVIKVVSKTTEKLDDVAMIEILDSID